MSMDNDWFIRCFLNFSRVKRENARGGSTIEARYAHMVLIRFAIIQVLIRKLFRSRRYLVSRTRKWSSLDDDPFSGVDHSLVSKWIMHCCAYEWHFINHDLNYDFLLQLWDWIYSDFWHLMRRWFKCKWYFFYLQFNNNDSMNLFQFIKLMK